MPVSLSGHSVHEETAKCRICSIAEGSAGLWQLDLNLARLIFTHHPLFSTEHVLAQRLYELYEHYETNEMKVTGSETENTTHVALKNVRQADISLVRNIVAAWKCIKAVRAKSGYVSTTVKLQLH
ncbi:unnamed protein product, partial [Coregonus sp. 'balchen']